MARLFDDASSQYLEASNPPVTGPPLTIAAWCRVNDQTVHSVIAGLYDADAQNLYELRVDQTFDAPRVVTANSGGFSSTTPSSTMTVDTWHHVAGVWASAASRAAYLDGTAEGTNTDSRTTTGIDRLVIGARLIASTYSLFTSGDIAEVGIWTAALSVGELLELWRGRSPLQVRPAALAHYWPLVGRHSPEPDLVGGLGLTLVNGPVASAHPRIFPAGGGNG